MGKLYTLDKKLLIGSPEIEIGDNKYPIDDRTKTVRKIMKLSVQLKEDENDESPEHYEVIDKILELAFGAKYREVNEVIGELSFKAYLDVIDIVLDAMTNGNPDEYEKKKAEEKSTTEKIMDNIHNLAGEEESNFRGPYESD